MSKYAAHYISHGVVLHRFYIGESPDELGTAAFWDAHIKELYDQLPFPEYWSGLDLQVWHMDSPKLDEMRASGEVNLEDYDLKTSGCQIAAGLFFSKDRLDLGVFPEGYKPEAVSPNKLTVTNLLNARKTLSHEAGHFHAMMCGAFDTGAYIRKEITRVFREQLQALSLAGQFGNEGEAWAEFYKSMLGAVECRGSFSDGKPFNPPRSLYLLFKTAYWLQGNLNQRVIDGFTVAENLVWWQDYSITYPIPGFPQLKSNGWFAVDQNWTKYKWQITNSGQWAWVKEG